MRGLVGFLVLATALTACTQERSPSPAASARATNPTPAASPPTAPSATPSPPPSPASYGGADIVWPSVRRTTSPPPALGAVRTMARVRTSTGGTLRAGLLLPRVGGDVVLTPCNRRVRLTGRTQLVPPRGTTPVVLLDPGHGGTADGTHSPTRAREADAVLDIAQRTARQLTGRVLLTRSADHDASLPFRVALADALRADLAVSVHLNAAPEGHLDRPGTSTFASVSDPNGRRAAGVFYEAHRRYLETLSSRVGHRWAGNSDAGALYRLGSRGTDYYGLLRRAHTTWVIVEPLFLTDPEEAALVADPTVRSGLAGAYVAGIRAYLKGAPGSGWRTPDPRPADPAPPPGQGGCVEPT